MPEGSVRTDIDIDTYTYTYTHRHANTLTYTHKLLVRTASVDQVIGEVDEHGVRLKVRRVEVTPLGCREELVRGERPQVGEADGVVCRCGSGEANVECVVCTVCRVAALL